MNMEAHIKTISVPILQWYSTPFMCTNDSKKLHLSQHKKQHCLLMYRAEHAMCINTRNTSHTQLLRPGIIVALKIKWHGCHDSKITLGPVSDIPRILAKQTQGTFCTRTIQINTNTVR